MPPPPTLPLDLGVLPPGGPLVVAVSGGPDSVALLAALCEVAPGRGLRLHVAHLDHGLRAEGAEDAAWVARLAGAWGLASTVAAADVGRYAAACGRGIEDAARQVRYAFLAGVARRVGTAAGAAPVATAHTADDQAETVLMNVLRGAGLDGLAAMAADAPWPLSPDAVRAAAAAAHLDAGPDGAPLPRLLRPLLAVDRAAVAGYLTAHGLTARDDASNADRTFLRNRIRHDLMPALEAVNPQLGAALARLAATAAADRAFIAAALDAAWPALASTAPATATATDDVARPARVALDAAVLGALHPALQGRAVRRAVAALGGDVRDLGHAHVAAVLDAVARACGVGRAQSTAGARDDDAAPPGAPTVLSLPGGIRATVDAAAVTFARGGAALPAARLDAAPVPLAVPGTTRLPGGWTVVATIADGRGGGGRGGDPWRFELDADGATVPLAARGRRPGDRLPLTGAAAGHKRLQDLFVDAKVPAAERDGWPIVVAGATIVWVPGLRADARFAAGPEAGRRVVLVVTAPGRVGGGGGMLRTVTR